MVNFTQCAVDYAKLTSNPDYTFPYAWTGRPIGIELSPNTTITTEGCLQLCGSGNDWYDWSEASATITTWVLPVIGMLLQAPFLSNAFWETVFSLARWVGNPMASLSYVLWNIRVSGKIAMMVDMAIPYNQTSGVPRAGSDFGSIRDSSYILMTMNQYTMKKQAVQKKEAEGLLRIALFSKDLQLRGSSRKLNQFRQDLAQEMREARKRGAVPVFISTMWFLFSLGISIQSAFGYIGQNTTAHDLALGCLLSWMPVLILCSIVDRNPVAADDIRNKLNLLVDSVRQSLMDDGIRQHFVESFQGNPQADKMEIWVSKIKDQCGHMSDFFEEFAGQGRKRWHYGAAHPILSDIEETYIASKGRNWLYNEDEARTHLVLGVDNGGLGWFDYRELWQIASAVAIVGGTCGGAFILSYFTPTVGLGCRSGGYTIFATTALGLLVSEMIVWWFIDAEKPETVRERARALSRKLTHHPRTSKVRKFFISVMVKIQQILTTMLDLLPQGMRKSLQAAQETWEQSSAQGKLEIAFFRPAEIINATWLLYVTLAQTFGAYVNCTCMSSTWAGYGGYIDFTQYSTTNSPWVKFYWTAGTAVSTAILTVAMVYIVAEWCLQSHISTSNYDSAMRGLRRTRQFRRATYPFRLATDIVIELAYLLRNLVYQALRRQKPLRPGRRSLKWTRSDGVPVNVVPSIELPDLGPRQRSGSQAADPLLGSDIADELPTPDLAHSRGASTRVSTDTLHGRFSWETPSSATEPTDFLQPGLQSGLGPRLTFERRTSNSDAVDPLDHGAHERR